MILTITGFGTAEDEDGRLYYRSRDDGKWVTYTGEQLLAQDRLREEGERLSREETEREWGPREWGPPPSDPF